MFSPKTRRRSLSTDVNQNLRSPRIFAPLLKHLHLQMRDFLLIKLIVFQEVPMRDYAICEIRMASINGKEGLTQTNKYTILT